MARPRARDLTERELEVMHAFWNVEGEATAAEIRDRLAESGLDRTYTTIATLVRNLEEKGFLAQVNRARPFRYRVAQTFEDISERFLGDLIERVFRGSREQLFVRLFKHKKLTARERTVLERDSQGGAAMNALGSILVWSAVPITAVAAVALLIERLASRRGPVAGAWVSSAALLVIVVLTPLAICGVPHRWSWRIPSLAGPPPRAADAIAGESGVAARLNSPASAATRIAGSDESRGVRWSLRWWRSLGDGASGDMSILRQRTHVLQSVWGAVVLSGAAWWLARFLLGLWGVRDGRRQSRLIESPDVLAEVESFRRALSIKRLVEVRELPSLNGSSAAAAGWLRPFVLLPRDWRSWTSLERRAVLAHEMAHIGRADYVLGIVAQLGLALYFYHPLVRWLVARLSLGQELAADALGAELAGGRGHYLVALSRMALRPEEKLFAWPARTFLPAGGHLIRRIQMLKENSPGRNRTLSAAMRVVTLTLLLAIGAGAVAFRGLAPARAAEVRPAATETKETSVQRFDISYLPSDAVGVYAIRPAAIARVPGLKPYVDKISSAISKELGLPALEAIEQATIEFKLLPRDPSKKKPGRFLTGNWVARPAQDFDWKPTINKMVQILKRPGKKPAELVEVPFENRSYFKVVDSALLGPGACFYFPDAPDRRLQFSGGGLAAADPRRRWPESRVPERRRLAAS